MVLFATIKIKRCFSSGKEQRIVTLPAKPIVMTNYLNDAVDLLKALIGTPSISREESEAADLLCTFLANYQLDYRRDGNNIWCTAPHFNANRPTLLLNAHIDTVKPAAGWQRHPYTATEEDGRIYGLGSNDDGGSVVCLLQTFRRLCLHPQSYNLIFLASCEEEVSGKNGVERILPQLPPISVAIVGEPTGMHPAIAEKGLMVLDVTAHGQSGHAARNEGINAIYRALPDIEWFRNHRFERVSSLLGAVKMSVTVIQAGTQHNVVPDTCTFTVDVRSNECYTNEELYNEICQHVASDVHARSFRLNSSHISPQHPLIRKAVDMGRQPYGSPTLSDQALMSFPSFKMGPGESSRSHTAEEYITRDELAEALELYFELLNGAIIPSSQF